jgi:hypothetical protein
MLRWVPAHIRSTLGHVRHTTLNGPFLTLPPSREQETVAAFEAAGYSCRRDDELTRHASGYSSQGA